jgi:hypothetical protein
MHACIAPLRTPCSCHSTTSQYVPQHNMSIGSLQQFPQAIPVPVVHSVSMHACIAPLPTLCSYHSTTSTRVTQHNISRGSLQRELSSPSRPVVPGLGMHEVSPYCLDTCIALFHPSLFLPALCCSLPPPSPPAKPPPTQKCQEHNHRDTYLGHWRARPWWGP